MKEVGILLKVGQTGLENLQKLTDGLNSAGIETKALDGKAAELSAELKRLADEQALIDAFKKQKQAVADAAAEMVAAKAKAGELGRALAGVEAPTKAQTTAFEKARTAARAADDAFTRQRTVLQELRTEMSAAGVSTQSLASAQVRVSQDSAKVVAGIERLQGEYRQLSQVANQTASNQVAAGAKVRDSLSDVSRQLTAVSTAAQAVIGGQLLGGLFGEISKTADAYANLAARMKLVTGEGAAFDTAFAGVFDVALRTNSALEETGTLFTRIAQAGKDIGVGQADALRLTETINQAVQLSGTSAEASKASITQLIQGLQSGVLRGEEFNSIMDQAPRLAQALAAGLGVTTGELRKMAEQGELTSQTVIKALQGQSATLEKEFSTLPATVGRALQNLSTQWTRYVGEATQAAGASKSVAGVINGLANNLDTVGAALLEAGKGFAAYTALRLAQTFKEKADAVKLAAVAVADETRAVGANTEASGANAGVKGTGATAVRASADAFKVESVAVADNTAAQLTNANASRGAAAARTGAAAATAGAAGALVGLSTAAGGAAVGIGRVGAASGELAGKADTAAAGAGRFAGAVGTVASAGLRVLSGLGWVAVAVSGVSLLKDAWTGLNGKVEEVIDRLSGLKAKQDAEAAAVKAAAEESRKAAQAKAELAQKMELAESRALGLSDKSRTLVADFNQMREKGTSTGEALQKLAKDMDLGSVQGIRDAVAALDALERKGKITSTQVRQTIAEALNGKDLGIFEAQAKAAFDGSAQGARRLKAAVDAVTEESLKRAGTSAQELKTGFSAALNSAINDTDALKASLKSMGASSEDTGRLLSKSLNKEVEAANTERGLAQVVTRIESMGLSASRASPLLAEAFKKRIELADTVEGVQKLEAEITKVGASSRLMGTDLSSSLDKAKAKIAELRGAFTAVFNDQARYQKLLAESAAYGLGASGGLGNLGGSLAARNAGVKSLYDPASGLYDKNGMRLNSSGQVESTSNQFAPPDDSGDWVFDAAGYQKAANAAARWGAGAPSQADIAKRFWLPKGGTSVGSSTSSSASSTGSSHTVTVNIGGRSTNINVASESDGSTLSSLLKELESAAGRAA